MLPIERQQRIKELVSLKKTLKISELSKELGVSEMTIHRDVKPLLESGFLIKTFGGIALAPEPGSVREKRSKATSCVFCSQLVSNRFAYRLILQNGKVEQACCAHCGILRQQQTHHEVMQAICQDFLRETTMSAHVAHYVIGSEVNVSCCQPQVLTFELREHAERFVKGFGGTVVTFEEASMMLLEKMNIPKHDEGKV